MATPNQAHTPLLKAGRSPHTAHKGRSTRKAVAVFVAPFAVLFLLFYAAPIIFAIIQSLLTVERE